MVGVDPEVQANHFCDVILPLMNDCSLPPALDLEDETNTIESEKLIADIHLFLDVVERRTGRKPIVYTGKYFMQARMGGTQSFKDYPLWDACYRPNPATPYNGWEKPAFWQYSGKSTNAGTVTDGDLFLGTPEELFALTRAGADKDGLSAADWATKYGIKIL
jgi:lysozyme